MNKEEINSAKEIFMFYGGSYFHMEREGDLIKYKSFNISRDREIEWLAEYRNDLACKILKEPTHSDCFSRYCNAIVLSKEYQSLHEVIKIVRANAEALDSFSKIRYAEELIVTIESLKKQRKHELYPEILNLAKALLQDVLTTPVKIAPHYRKLNYLRSILTKEKIVSRAIANLKKLSK